MTILILSSIIIEIITLFIVLAFLEDIKERIGVQKIINYNIENMVKNINSEHDYIEQFLRNVCETKKSFEFFIEGVFKIKFDESFKKTEKKLEDVLNFLKQNNEERLLEYVSKYFDKEGKEVILSRLKNSKEAKNE